MSGLSRIAEAPALRRLRDEAATRNVPIITEEGAAFLRQLTTLLKPARVLEIGTAIGFSAAVMAYAYDGAIIDTVEKRITLVNEAKHNLSKLALITRVRVHHEDALAFTPDANTAYDLVFIDAAKAQGVRFFERFAPYVKTGGVIVADNLLFHGLVGQAPDSKDLAQLVRKIDRFNRYVLDRDDFDSMIYTVGDGMSVSIKKG